MEATRLGCRVLLALACALMLSSLALSGPLESGGDTRDLDRLAAVAFEAPAKVRPGETGSVAFSLTNRLNQTMGSVKADLAFSYGGDWLDARPITAGQSDVPAFVGAGQVPHDLAAGETRRFESNYTTTPATTPGVYLVSLVVSFTYRNITGVTRTARYVSLSSIDSSLRGKVNLTDYNGTLDALSQGGDTVDGIVPDSSIEVVGAGALALFLDAAAFGVAVLAVGTLYGWTRERRRKAKGRQGG